MSPYQKLKAEVAKLKQDLDIVVNEPFSMRGLEIAHQWKLNRKMEESIMAGSVSDETEKYEKPFDDENPDYIRSSQEEI